jgi:hypothetical protein
MVLRSTPLFLDVSGTKVRWNPIASIRNNDFFRTLEKLQADTELFRTKKGLTFLKSTLFISIFLIFNSKLNYSKRINKSTIMMIAPTERYTP